MPLHRTLAGFAAGICALAFAFSVSAQTPPVPVIPEPPPALVEFVNPTHRVATPANFSGVLFEAKCGDQVDLSAGDYPIIRVYNLRPTCPVVIDASAAVIHYMPFANSANWIVERANFAAYVYGQLTISGSDHIAVRNSRFVGAGTAGIGIANSSYIEASGNHVDASSGDGFDVSGDSHFVVIRDNACTNNILTAIHPDCGQAWSVVGKPQLTDLWFIHNTAVCHCQGWSGFDNVGLGYSRIYEDGNTIATINSWAGSFNRCKGCIMVHNRAYTLIGEPHGWVPPSWYVSDGAGATLPNSPTSGNYAADNLIGVAP